MRRVHPWIAFACALSASGCRDGLSPFEMDPATPDTAGIVHLTYSAADDLYPAWSADGQSVIYTANAFPGSPPGRGLLYSIPRAGGRAELVFPDLQGVGESGSRWLGSSSPGKDGRVAFMDLDVIVADQPVVNADCRIQDPILVFGLLFVRTPGETGDVFDDPATGVTFPGPDVSQLSGSTGPFVSHTYPVQQRFLDTGVLDARASWSPDGVLVFSNGLSLITWPPGESQHRIQGVTDAASPAWSPDGEWIAYTRVERGDSTTQICTRTAGKNVISYLRTGYEAPRTVIALVKPDGTQRIDLHDGTEPAWSPDGHWIYYHTNNRIERIPAEGGTSVPVPDTQGGWWPAVSPDGERLAFMRRQGGLRNWDIWVVPLPR